MHVIRGTNNVDAMQRMYNHVHRAPQIEVRGSKTKNVHNLAVVFDANQPVITSFAPRKFNLDYAKKEWLWYLGADKFDSSIEEHAAMWQKLKQADGSYHSNYGQYIFYREPVDDGDPTESQFDYVVKTLLKDPYSRRASMVLLQPYHLYEENSDVVCTYGINFTIEAGRLNMTVMMRSNDVIFGFTNDAFCFWNLYTFVYSALAGNGFDLPILPGTYTHFTNSMHVYERHYKMIAELAAMRTMAQYDPIEVPWPTSFEVRCLVDSNGREGDGPYIQWLKA